MLEIQKALLIAGFFICNRRFPIGNLKITDWVKSKISHRKIEKPPGYGLNKGNQTGSNSLNPGKSEKPRSRMIWQKLFR